MKISKRFLIVHFKYAWRAKFLFELKNITDIFLKYLSELLFLSPELPFWKCSYNKFSIRDFFKGLKLKSHAMFKPHLIDLLSCKFSTVFSEQMAGYDFVFSSRDSSTRLPLTAKIILLKIKKKLKETKSFFFLPNSVDVVLCQCSIKVYL